MLLRTPTLSIYPTPITFALSTLVVLPVQLHLLNYLIALIKITSKAATKLTLLRLPARLWCALLSGGTVLRQNPQAEPVIGHAPRLTVLVCGGGRTSFCWFEAFVPPLGRGERNPLTLSTKQGVSYVTAKQFRFQRFQ